MPLFKKTTQPAPQKPKAPTLDERAERALVDADNSVTLAQTAVNALRSSAERLEIVSLDAAEEAARLSAISNKTGRAASEAEQRAEAIREVVA